MPFQGDELYRNQDQILMAMLAAFQAAIPDVWIDQDGNLRLICEVEAGQIEGLFLANQLLLENVFVQSANLVALTRHGEQYGVDRKIGTNSVGQLNFFGQGGTYIPIGAEVAYDPGGGQDPLYFITTQDGNIPNPGIPTAPVIADGGVGLLPAGTYEYAVNFVTDWAFGAQTSLGDISDPLILAVNRIVHLSSIPIGGPGTVARQIFRQVDGGTWQYVDVINDNTTTIYNDNITSTTPVDPATDLIDNAEIITLDAQSEETGIAYNAVTGAITVLANVPDGVTDVINQSAFTGGTDEEDIDTYRNRILSTLRSPASGSPTDLKNWAESVLGIESASIFPNDNLGTPTPGHVTVRVSGPNGSIPGTDVINAVAAELTSHDLANITIHITTFTPVSLAVTVTVTAATNYTHADLVPNVQLAIANYIASVPVGGTVYISGIIQYVREVAGVADVTVSAPASNQTAAATSKFVPGTITVL